MAKKNEKTTGCPGTLANTRDLEATGLVGGVVRGPCEDGDEPGVTRTCGNRGPRPESN